MKRKIITFCIIIACFILECTVFPNLSLASITPNLLIVVTSSFGFMRGKKEGMFIGFFSGLLIDLFFGDVLGFYALLYMYVGYVNGFFRAIFFQDDIKLPMLLISASDLACNLCIYFFRFLFRKQFDIGYYFLHLMIPELVYTLLVTILLYWLI